jgi:hypothetical protein
MLRILCTALLLSLAVLPRPASAQLDQTLQAVFDQILREDFELSPGPHADHFIPAADIASRALTPALNNLIASNVSSFPLSSTIAGVTFDFSTGQPVSIIESQGPIFAEIGETLGRNKLTLGASATYLNLNRLRGMPLDDVTFNFTHQDIGEPGLGDDPTESDVVNVALDLDVNATIFSFAATYGVTPNLDVGIAIPFINLSMSGTARAVVQSYTLFVQDRFGGGARHYFGGTPQNPILTNEVPYEETAAGIGDIALRFKYRLPLHGLLQTAALLDVRLPTGDQNNFLGTGSENLRLLVVGSRRIGTFTPHINAGYSYRGADFDSDEFELIIGFDQKIGRGLTFALDVLSNLDLQSDESIRFYDPAEGPVATIRDQSPPPPTGTGAVAERVISISNVADQNYDNRVDAALGFRFAPSEQLQLLANVLVPLQDGGLRSTIAPTLGLSLNF